jgi:TIR domain
LQGVEETRPEIELINADVEAAVSRVIEQIEPKYGETIRQFASLGGRRDFTYAEMLKELAQTKDGFLSFPLLETERPDLTAGARRFVDGKFIETVYASVPIARNHLLFDDAIPAFVIDDPQLSFYLQQTPKSKLLRPSGKSTAISRDRVFVSYSHKDTKWLERLRVHLRPLERDNVLSIWDETKIKVGSLWRDEIKAAIDSAKVAVLLISANFLSSDFIMDNELPPLLEAAVGDGAMVMVVLVSPSRFQETRALEKFQALNLPNKPLSKMTFNQQEEALVKLSKSIEDALSAAS